MAYTEVLIDAELLEQLLSFVQVRLESSQRISKATRADLERIVTETTKALSGRARNT